MTSVYLDSIKDGDLELLRTQLSTWAEIPQKEVRGRESSCREGRRQLGTKPHQKNSLDSTIVPRRVKTMLNSSTIFLEWRSLSSIEEVVEYLVPQEKDHKTEDEEHGGGSRYSREGYQAIVDHFYKGLNSKAQFSKDRKILNLFRKWLKQRAKTNQRFLNKKRSLKVHHISYIKNCTNEVLAHCWH